MITNRNIRTISLIALIPGFLIVSHGLSNHSDLSVWIGVIYIDVVAYIGGRFHYLK